MAMPDVLRYGKVLNSVRGSFLDVAQALDDDKREMKAGIEDNGERTFSDIEHSAIGRLCT
jgi:hypothetical protein